MPGGAMMFNTAFPTHLFFSDFHLPPLLLGMSFVQPASVAGTGREQANELETNLCRSSHIYYDYTEREIRRARLGQSSSASG